MALRKILSYTDPVLRQKSKLITEFDARLALLIDDMKETLIKAQGAGLAANQIGILKQVCIVMIDDDYYEFINPEITFKSKKMVNDYEGCLSVLDSDGSIIDKKVERHESIKVKAFDRNGKTFTVELSDYLARAAQHEIDHLSGILFIDYLKK